MHRLLMTVVLIGSFAAAQTADAAKAANAPAGNAENGKKLYTNYGCYECHGREGQGGSAGARLAPRPIPFSVLVMYVRHPAGQMPPYTSKVVTDAELADIYAFLKSIRPPPPAKSIPLLNQ
jgi:ubiquinol-cytochrome c reductase cytochrome c subunit